jgi:hypothetical protein
MAIVVRFAVTGMTAAKYEEALRRLAAAGAAAPPGRLYHVSYGAQDNLQVIDVYDSPESLETFGATLVPILRELGIHASPQVDPICKIVRG